MPQHRGGPAVSFMSALMTIWTGPSSRSIWSADLPLMTRLSMSGVQPFSRSWAAMPGRYRPAISAQALSSAARAASLACSTASWRVFSVRV
ncbi:hypothetical protein ATE80_24245 [Streptomyces kanasensis]|uniref:Uncharacterized protein n=1 Tax=Streptomyces kanasensis TaxID=936756 RepID=A0A124EC24_9ACTN|nr:hypothetical protein ATE80_24245 [Streptomyces kanasensis]